MRPGRAGGGERTRGPERGGAQVPWGVVGAVGRGGPGIPSAPRDPRSASAFPSPTLPARTESQVLRLSAEWLVLSSESYGHCFSSQIKL